MNRIRRRRSAPRLRSGLTLIELMVVAVLLSVIGAMLTGLLVRQQRFHRTVTTVTDARAHMRDIATILPTDIRGVSTVGMDILSRGVSEMQFRASVGTSVLCSYAAGDIIELPPLKLSSGMVLSAWINPPAAGDIAFIYNDGTEVGNLDDEWTPYAITEVASAADPSWCPTTTMFTTAGDNGQKRYRLKLNTAPNAARIKPGAAIRIAREVRYSMYVGADGKSYVGYQRCTPILPVGTAPGVCLSPEVLAGPVLSATTDTLTSGLYFAYYKQNGAPATLPTDTIAWISVGVRTASESMKRATATTMNSFTGGDSLKFTIGFRNRI